MSKDLALKITAIISLAGMLFSGYLSYGELTARICPLEGGCTAISGIPACVYGFVMYAVVFIVCLFGIRTKK
ncbi:MAG: hypothetical protein ACOYUZ_04715 [Patescibacteria group bacterium]